MSVCSRSFNKKKNEKKAEPSLFSKLFRDMLAGSFLILVLGEEEKKKVYLEWGWIVLNL